MYLSTLVKPIINKELKEKCIGKKISFDVCDETYIVDEMTIKCKDVEFCDDDGNCCIIFTDDNDQKYTIEGQGLDIWFDIEDDIVSNVTRVW